MELNLFEAAKNGNLETVKELVERGANIETRDDYRWTVLMQASRYGYLEVVEYLEKALWNQRVKRAIPRINLGIPLVIESLLIRN